MRLRRVRNRLNLLDKVKHLTIMEIEMGDLLKSLSGIEFVLIGFGLLVGVVGVFIVKYLIGLVS